MELQWYYPCIILINHDSWTWLGCRLTRLGLRGNAIEVGCTVGSGELGKCRNLSRNIWIKDDFINRNGSKTGVSTIKKCGILSGNYQTCVVSAPKRLGGWVSADLLLFVFRIRAWLHWPGPQDRAGKMRTSGVSINGGSPKNGWFISWKIPLKWMMTGCTISGNHQIEIGYREQADGPKKNIGVPIFRQSHESRFGLLYLA